MARIKSPQTVQGGRPIVVPRDRPASDQIIRLPDPRVDHAVACEPLNHAPDRLLTPQEQEQEEALALFQAYVAYRADAGRDGGDNQGGE